MITLRTTRMAALAVLVVAVSAPAPAQPGFGRGRPRLDPETQGKVWSLQAQSVAGHLELNQEAAGKLAAAYKEAQGRLQEGLSSPGGGEEGDWQARRERFQKARAEQREALSKELAGFLDEEKTKKASDLLGLFSGSWDFMTNTLSTILSNQETLSKAVLVAQAHVVKMESAFAGGGSEGGSREERMERFQKLREEMNAELGKILSEEELAKWKEATALGQRRREGRE